MSVAELWPLGAVLALLALTALAARSGRRAPSSVDALAAGQERLAGALREMSEAQARTSDLLERRLGEARGEMAESLAGSARALGAVEARLDGIDRAQGHLERLSEGMLGLEAILKNKQARGRFGEIQLEALLQDALPAGAYRLQATLPNGRRADCVIDAPAPAGPLVIDAKFPLEAYEALIAAEGRDAEARALKALGLAVRGHMVDIAERYVLPGVTGDGAVMFLPSEAIFATLHERLPEVVRDGFRLRVFVVSPTTCMALLTSLAAVLRDLRLRDEIGALRGELAALAREVTGVEAQATRLARHLALADEDLAAIGRGAGRAARRVGRLEAGAFGGLAEETG